MSDSNIDSVELEQLEDSTHENGGDESTGGLADDEAQDNDETNDDANQNNNVDSSEDPELEAIKARVREMEEEAEKLKQMQDEVEKQMSCSPPASTSGMSIEEKMEVDGRSVYVGNVDYSATADDLERHFHG